ncbi:MAG: AraC family transcriptional regulator [Gammaproteobacteria bacterium]|nr:AraC family transcriptional regulator [Gammaproteobacteria bacterium]
MVITIGIEEQSEVIKLCRHHLHDVKTYLNFDIISSPEYFKKIDIIIFFVDIRTEQHLESLRIFKEKKPTHPILLISNEFMDHIALWSLRNRMWDYIVLPSETNYFIQKVNDLAQKLYSADYTDKPKYRTTWFPASGAKVVPIVEKENHTNRTNKAIHAIKTHIEKKITISHLAKCCGMSEKTFSRVFKKEHGLTTQDYIINLRMNEARKLLSDHRKPIQSISFDVGYENISQFNRLFKRNFGLTPSAYRRQENSVTGSGSTST